MASTTPQPTQPTSTAAPTAVPVPAPTNTTNIVILGGNHAGLGTLHTLARHTIPALQRLSSSPSTYKITLLTPNTHFFFKPASPRALIQPDLLPGGEGEDKIFRPLSEAIKQYGDLVTVIRGFAVGVDMDKKEVKFKHVDVGGSGDGLFVPPSSTDEGVVRYDVLIIATGTKARSALWTLPSGPEVQTFKSAHEVVQKQWGEIRTKLKNLQSPGHQHHNILIAGGGPVGVETAGEVAAWLKAEGKTEGVTVTLLSGSDRLLGRNCGEGLGRKAEGYLKKNFGGLVRVRHGVKVVGTADSSPAGGAGAAEGSAVQDEEAAQKETTVTLSDGSTTTVALYIDATGGSGTASAFLPSTWLDATGRINTDEFFRARGPSSSDSPSSGAAAGGIYAVGDVVSGSDNTLISTNFQVPVVCSSIGVDLAAQILGPDKEGNGNGVKLPAALKQKTYKNKLSGTLLVPIGPGGGVGQVMGWGVPSFLVKVMKAKGFLVEMVEPAVDGSQWK
ncbi:hypothetical protein B0T20DRAFT_425468 [Sordaria brevicollis]|uniref:FAD/NAD(P)-binding domain-containing protein n=1 Tax=Sordaria brevicollis TaxID=83679 RepID=A0AAE0U2R9_SORBR|nr:hypothetical protein B0T20DRAFT_425468 [Sordaria brevicollis]